MKYNNRIFSTSEVKITQVKPGKFAEAIDPIAHLKGGDPFGFTEHSDQQEASESSGGFSVSIGNKGASASQPGQNMAQRVLGVQLRINQPDREKTIGSGKITIKKAIPATLGVAYDLSGTAVVADAPFDTVEESFKVQMNQGEGDIYVLFGYQDSGDDEVVPAGAAVVTRVVADPADTVAEQAALEFMGSGFASGSGFTVRAEPLLPGSLALREFRELIGQ